MLPTIYTITTLTRYIKSIFDEDLTLQSVWVRGEISNLTRHSSGHLYFTLKDAGSRLRSVMFRGNATTLKFMPENGMNVLVLGSVSLYEKSGDYQLYVQVMEPEGKGSLYVAYEQLRAKLESEGLFEKARKRPIPKMPLKIGVLTSPTGAAVRDVITICRRRFPKVSLLVIPTIVQGTNAPGSIIESLKTANNRTDIDLIILGRGGGSIEELWAFNDEGVARAIASSSVPVISAVGHETDFTIADFVADMRAPTPSGAAELAVPDISALRQRVSNLQSRLYPSMIRRLKLLRDRLGRLESSPGLSRPMTIVNGRKQDLDILYNRLVETMSLQQVSRRAALNTTAASLNALSPLAVLSRGYAICTGPSGKVIREASALSPGDNISVKLMSGSINCDVTAVSENDK